MFVIEMVLGEMSETLQDSVVKHQEQLKNEAHPFGSVFFLTSIYLESEHY